MKAALKIATSVRIAVVAYSAVIHEPLENLDVPLVAAALAGFPNGSINVFDRDLRYVFAAGTNCQMGGAAGATPNYSATTGRCSSG